MAVALIHHHSSWAPPLIALAVIALILLVSSYLRSKKNSVNLDVSVGDVERHTVHYFRNAFTGRVRIAVDGNSVQSNIEWATWKMEKSYECPVGESERHLVTFVKTRKKVAPGFRKQPVTAYVDGVLAGTG
jgi:hypothetical protein